jgi:glycosyltransferase involved in cell wall biosynthesis
VVIFINERYDHRLLVKGLDTQRIKIVRYRWKTLADFGAVPVKLRKSGHTLLAWLVRCLNLAIRYPHIFLSAIYLSRCFKRYAIDFVISNNGGYPGGEMCRAAVLGARLRRTNALMIVHNMPTKPPTVLRPIEKIMDHLVSRCTSLTAVSEAVSEALGRIRFLGKRADVIENAVEKPVAQPIGRPHLAVTDILCIGGIAPFKNQIKAVLVYRILVRKLLAERPSTGIPTLTFIGPTADQDYHSKLTSVIAADKIEQERISLTGYCDPRVYLARPGQLLLITSNVEGLPLVLLEAMSYGVPAVSTDVGGISAAIANGANGEIRSIDDVEGLAQSLWRYVTDASAYSDASRQCIETFNARYSIDSWIRKYQNLITSLSRLPRYA